MYRSAPRMCTSRNDCPRRTTCNPNNSFCSPWGLGAGFAKYHTGTGRACQRSLFLWRDLGSSGRAADPKSIPAPSADSLPSLVVCYNHLSQPPPHLAKGTRRGRTNICFAFCQDKQPALESVRMYRQSLSAHYSLASHYKELFSFLFVWNLSCFEGLAGCNFFSKDWVKLSGRYTRNMKVVNDVYTSILGKVNYSSQWQSSSYTREKMKKKKNPHL